MAMVHLLSLADFCKLKHFVLGPIFKKKVLSVVLNNPSVFIHTVAV